MEYLRGRKGMGSRRRVRLPAEATDLRNQVKNEFAEQTMVLQKLLQEVNPKGQKHDYIIKKKDTVRRLGNAARHDR